MKLDHAPLTYMVEELNRLEILELGSAVSFVEVLIAVENEAKKAAKKLRRFRQPLKPL